MTTNTSQHSFDIGTIAFEAIRYQFPRPHWRVRLVETGEIFRSGAGGISNDSVPKMKNTIQELLDRVSKGDVLDFRKRFGLPPTKIDDPTQAKNNFEQSLAAFKALIAQYGNKWTAAVPKSAYDQLEKCNAYLTEDDRTAVLRLFA